VQGTIGSGANNIYSDYLTEQGRAYVAFDDSTDPVEAVLSGKVDVILVDHGYGVKKLAEHEGELEIVGPSVLLDRGLGIGVRMGSELKGRLDEALASMKDDGTLNAIIVRWVGQDASTFE
ncbi:MAG: transporter substrate-binding domain-containing protein, partial [Dehalococcoidia bacterium]|nr:transporter substrate-binding domain-containing protein [Dehalococcoidia bacterium]